MESKYIVIAHKNGTQSRYIEVEPENFKDLDSARALYVLRTQYSSSFKQEFPDSLHSYIFYDDKNTEYIVILNKVTNEKTIFKQSYTPGHEYMKFTALEPNAEITEYKLPSYEKLYKKIDGPCDVEKIRMYTKGFITSIFYDTDNKTYLFSCDNRSKQITQIHNEFNIKNYGIQNITFKQSIQLLFAKNELTLDEVIEHQTAEKIKPNV